MLDNKDYELINKEIDSANSPKEQERLRKLLDRSPEARRTLEDLRQLTAMFRNAPRIDPPSYLKTKILNSLPRPVRARTGQPAFITKLLDLVRQPRVRYAYVLAGGTVAGIALFFLLTATPDTSTLVGTMGSASAAGATAEFDMPSIRGAIRADLAGNLVQTSISLNTEEDVDVILEFAEQHLQFESFRGPENARASLTIHPGELRLRNTGENAFTLVFRAQSPDPVVLNATVVARGVVVSQKILTLKQTSHQ